MTGSKQRATLHNGRWGKASHNDRTFDSSNDDGHIDKSKSHLNKYWKCYKTAKDFEEAEEMFYAKNFGDYLEKSNKKAISQRHPERVRSLKDLLHGKQTCPEESIYQIGNKENHEDQDKLLAAYNEFIKWRSAAFPQLKLLDIALHVEEATWHIQERRAWVCHDKDGTLRPGQTKALEEMGVPLPNPNAKPSRTNNRKQTFDRICREKWLEIIKSRGIDIETEPIGDKRKHIEKNDMIIGKQQKLLTELENKIQAHQPPEEALAAKEALKRASHKPDGLMSKEHYELNPQDFSKIKAAVESGANAAKVELHYQEKLNNLESKISSSESMIDYLKSENNKLNLELQRKDKTIQQASPVIKNTYLLKNVAEIAQNALKMIRNRLAYEMVGEMLKNGIRPLNGAQIVNSKAYDRVIAPAFHDVGVTPVRKEVAQDLDRAIKAHDDGSMPPPSLINHQEEKAGDWSMLSDLTKDAIKQSISNLDRY